MSRSAKKKYIAICLNDGGTYGEDHIAAGGTGVIIQTSELSIDPFVGDEIDRNLDDGSVGNSPVLLVGTHVTLSFNVEVAGSGTNTTEVPYADLLSICGYDAAVAADHVLYSRNLTGTEKSATIYYYEDGVLHKLLGARANVSISLEAKSLGQFAFEVTGMYGGVVSQAFATPDLTAFMKPKKVGNAFTTFKLDGVKRNLISFEANPQNEVVYTEFVGDEEVGINDWNPDGNITIEAPALAELDPFAIAESEAQMPVEIVHGVAGNRITIASTHIQLGRPSYGDQDNVRTYELPARYITDFTIKSD